MNFVLKPQNFQRQELKFTDQYRTGFAVHDDHLQRQFLRRYMRQVMQRYPVPRRPGFNSRIERRGELDGALFNHDHRQRGRGLDQHQQQSNHREFPATPLCDPSARPADYRGAGAVERGDDGAKRGISLGIRGRNLQIGVVALSVTTKQASLYSSTVQGGGNLRAVTCSTYE